MGGDDEQLDLTESELAVDMLGVERKDVFGSLQDGIRDEGGTVGAGFNAATEEVVEGLGISALATHLVFDAAGTDHGRHLRSKPDEWLRDVRNTGLPSRCQVAQNGMSPVASVPGRFCPRSLPVRSLPVASPSPPVRPPPTKKT